MIITQVCNYVRQYSKLVGKCYLSCQSDDSVVYFILEHQFVCVIKKGTVVMSIPQNPNVDQKIKKPGMQKAYKKRKNNGLALFIRGVISFCLFLGLTLVVVWYFFRKEEGHGWFSDRHTTRKRFKWKKETSSSKYVSDFFQKTWRVYFCDIRPGFCCRIMRTRI